MAGYRTLKPRPIPAPSGLNKRGGSSFVTKIPKMIIETPPSKKTASLSKKQEAGSSSSKPSASKSVPVSAKVAVKAKTARKAISIKVQLPTGGYKELGPKRVSPATPSVKALSKSNWVQSPVSVQSKKSEKVASGKSALPSSQSTVGSSSAMPGSYKAPKLMVDPRYMPVSAKDSEMSKFGEGVRPSHGLHVPGDNQRRDRLRDRPRDRRHRPGTPTSYQLSRRHPAGTEAERYRHGQTKQKRGRISRTTAIVVLILVGLLLLTIIIIGIYFGMRNQEK